MRQLKCPTGTPVLRLVCQHLADGEPVCLEERLINLDTVPEASEESFRDISPGTWLLEHVPWTEGEHVFQAEAASLELARWLAIEPTVPCIIVQRRTWNGEDPVTFVRLSYPGDRHRFRGRFAPPNL